MTVQSRSRTKRLVAILLLCLAIGGVGVFGWLYSGDAAQALEFSKVSQETLLEEQEQLRYDSIEAELRNGSDSVFFQPDSAIADADFQIKKETSSPLSIAGRRINIAVIGVDSRLGDHTKHADANHILSIIPDSGVIQIFSVPRDTPADAGMPDTSGQNKLTIVYANRGSRAYLSEISRITGIGDIPYYIEVGFSQAMGIIEMLGYKDSRSTLQVLRSRKGLGGDDYQRCYNQAQFIRQGILSHFHRLDDVSGDLLLRAVLKLTKTNISASTAHSIAAELKKNGFPRNPETISVHVRPRTTMKFKVYDFTDEETLTRLRTKIERFNKYAEEGEPVSRDIQQKLIGRLNSSLEKARSDSAKRPSQVVRTLITLYRQRAWLQVQDKQKRDMFRDDFSELLHAAYIRQNKMDEAAEVLATLELEKKIYSTEKTP